MKHIVIKLLFSIAIYTVAVFAQPSLTTLTPVYWADGIGDRGLLPGRYAYSNCLYLLAKINPNGGTYNVYFECGFNQNYSFSAPTEDWTVSGGSTVVVTSNRDPLTALFNSVNWNIYDSTIHYRVVAINASGKKFYGRDVAFKPQIGYHPTFAEFKGYHLNGTTESIYTIHNFLPIPVTLNFSNLDISENFTLAANSIVYPIGDRYTPATLSYNGHQIKDIAPSEALAWDLPTTADLIYCNALGFVNNNQNVLYRITNNNPQPVTLLLMSGYNTLTVTVPIFGGVEVVAQPGGMEIDLGEMALMVIHDPVIPWGRGPLLRAVPLHAGAVSSVFELQNNDDKLREFVLRDTSGNTYTESMPPNSSKVITIPTADYDLYVNSPILYCMQPTPVPGHFRVGSVSPGNAPLTASKDSLTFVRAGGTDTLIIDGSCWTASCNQPWLQLDRNNGYESEPLMISAEANYSGSTRSAVITISNGYTSRQIPVVQDTAFHCAVSLSKLAFTANGQSKTFTIAADTTWTVTSDQPWVTFNKAGGSSSTDTITVQAAANTTLFARTAIVTAAASNIRRSIAIAQDPFVPSVSVPGAILLRASADSTTLVITANTAWSLSNTQPWLSVTKTSGTGTDTLLLTAAANSGAERSATLTISAVNFENQTVLVQQQAMEQTVAKTLTPAFYHWGIGEMGVLEDFLTQRYLYLVGQVSPNNNFYTTYFEYGWDQNYGHTTPTMYNDFSGTAIYTVPSSADPLTAFFNEANWDIYNRTVHYRMVAVNSSGEKFYGRDVAFQPQLAYHPTFVSPVPRCDNAATTQQYFMSYAMPCATTYTYECLGQSGTITSQLINGGEIFTDKIYPTNFYYNNRLFKVVTPEPSNCQPTGLSRAHIFVNALGTVNNGADQLLHITNYNWSAVTLQLYHGSTTSTITIESFASVNVITELSDVEIDLDNDPIKIISAPYITWGRGPLLRVTPLRAGEATTEYELENNEEKQRIFVLRDPSGNMYRDTLAANSYKTITLPTAAYDVYIGGSDIICRQPTLVPGCFRLYAGVQPGTTLAVDKTNKAYTPRGFTDTVLVTTASPWKATSGSSWLTLLTSQDNCSGKLVYAAAPNAGSTGRTAPITVTNGCDTKTITVTQGASPGTALSFDGTNDHVTAPDLDDSIAAFTAEAWVLWQPDAAADVQFICGKGMEQMELHTGGGSGTNGLRFIPATGVYLDAAGVLPVGVWTHVAAVYDPSQSLARVYINGNEVTAVNHGSNPVSTPVANTAALFHIGNRVDNTYSFKGIIDEVKIWKTVRTQAEIRQDMLTPMNQTEAGLVEYYSFDDAIPAEANAGRTTLTGLNGLNGTLQNFALTGSSSNWVESRAMAVPLPLAASDITVQSFRANWQAPAFGAVESYTIEAATDAFFQLPITGSPYTITAPAVSATLPLPFSSDVYYRVRANKSSASGTSLWSAPVIVSQSLPVELISFTAAYHSGNVTLNWETASEVNNFGFGIERKVPGAGWTPVGFVPGRGNSNAPVQYSYEDKNAPGGTIQYRLKQTDLDGKFEYGPVISVAVELPKQFALRQNYPNPFNPATTIKYEIPNPCNVSLIVYDVLGREVAVLVQEQKLPGRYDVVFDANSAHKGSSIASGIYFYRLQAGSYIETKKLLLIK